MAEERNFRKVRRGYVVSDKMDKTITVELEQRSTHPLYGKVVRSTSKVKYYGNSASEQDQALASRIHYRARQVSKVRQGSPFTGALWATTMPR